MNDRPVRIRDGTYLVYITQTNMDGLCVLIKWLDGFEAAKSGVIPGHFELVMQYRNLVSAVSKGCVAVEESHE